MSRIQSLLSSGINVPDVTLPTPSLGSDQIGQAVQTTAQILHAHNEQKKRIGDQNQYNEAITNYQKMSDDFLTNAQEANMAVNDIPAQFEMKRADMESILDTIEDEDTRNNARQLMLRDFNKTMTGYKRNAFQFNKDTAIHGFREKYAGMVMTGDTDGAEIELRQIRKTLSESDVQAIVGPIHRRKELITLDQISKDSPDSLVGVGAEQLTASFPSLTDSDIIRYTDKAYTTQQREEYGREIGEFNTMEYQLTVQALEGNASVPAQLDVLVGKISDSSLPKEVKDSKIRLVKESIGNIMLTDYVSDPENRQDLEGNPELIVAFGKANGASVRQMISYKEAFSAAHRQSITDDIVQFNETLIMDSVQAVAMGEAPPLGIEEIDDRKIMLAFLRSDRIIDNATYTRLYSGLNRVEQSYYDPRKSIGEIYDNYKTDPTAIKPEDNDASDIMSHRFGKTNLAVKDDKELPAFSEQTDPGLYRFGGMLADSALVGQIPTKQFEELNVELRKLHESNSPNRLRQVVNIIKNASINAREGELQFFRGNESFMMMIGGLAEMDVSDIDAMQKAPKFGLAAFSSRSQDYIDGLSDTLGGTQNQTQADFLRGLDDVPDEIADAWEHDESYRKSVINRASVKYGFGGINDPLDATKQAMGSVYEEMRGKGGRGFGGQSVPGGGRSGGILSISSAQRSIQLRPIIQQFFDRETIPKITSAGYVEFVSAVKKYDNSLAEAHKAYTQISEDTRGITLDEFTMQVYLGEKTFAVPSAFTSQPQIGAARDLSVVRKQRYNELYKSLVESWHDVESLMSVRPTDYSGANPTYEMGVRSVRTSGDVIPLLDDDHVLYMKDLRAESQVRPR